MKNDELRQLCILCVDGSVSVEQAGLIVVTSLFHSKPLAWKIGALTMIQKFDRFNGDNDPYKEHDLVLLEFEGVMVRAQFGYYADKEMVEGADDPADCFRVLTIGLASDF
jgi:hypothetical protein